MLAIATNTRSMKGSPVFRSLKSWASKIHQQLPLNPKESQRLLTALTGSFRQHLDEVHPWSASADARPQPGAKEITTERSRGFHSSAAAADQHLSSILTSPLLSKGQRSNVRKADQDLAIAKVELQKNFAKDPITLLEEYEAKGAATVPIAHLCLQTFEGSLVGLQAAKQREVVNETKPGQRTLAWLWRSQLHLSEAFIEDLNFKDVLILASMREGLDDYLWEWLKLDMKTDTWANSKSGNYTRSMYHRYRWKGRILRGMVLCKLNPSYDLKPSLDDAFDVWFRALAMKREAEKGSHMAFLPVHGAGSLLHNSLLTHRHRFPAVDVRRYDRFTQLGGFSNSANYGGHDLPADLDSAILGLHHPERPIGLPTLSVLRRLFDEGPSEDTNLINNRQGLVDHITDTSKSRVKATFWWNQFVRAVHLLRMDGYKEEAAWVRDRITEFYPDLDGMTGPTLQALADGRLRAGSNRADPENTSDFIRVPFPTFT